MTDQSFIPATTARKNLFDLIQKAQTSILPITITVHGVPSAVLLSKEEYDGWMATFETLEDKDLLQSIKQSEKDLEKKNYLSLDEYVSSTASQISHKRSKKT